MRIILIAFYSVLFIATQVFADRVCIRKSDGFPIEYQTGDARLGTLTENAVRAGYKESEVEEKYITPQAYKALSEEKIDKPARDARKAKTDAAKEKIKQKLGLSDKELNELKEALE